MKNNQIIADTTELMHECIKHYELKEPFAVRIILEGTDCIPIINFVNQLDSMLKASSVVHELPPIPEMRVQVFHFIAEIGMEFIMTVGYAKSLDVTDIYLAYFAPVI